MILLSRSEACAGSVGPCLRLRVHCAVFGRSLVEEFLAYFQGFPILTHAGIHVSVAFWLERAVQRWLCADWCRRPPLEYGQLWPFERCDVGQMISSRCSSGPHP